MKNILIFLVAFYLGTEVQAWWYRKGCTLFFEWKKRKEKRK
jgi:hypothetical protein